MKSQQRRENKRQCMGRSGSQCVSLWARELSQDKWPDFKEVKIPNLRRNCSPTFFLHSKPEMNVEGLKSFTHKPKMRSIQSIRIFKK